MCGINIEKCQTTKRRNSHRAAPSCVCLTKNLFVGMKILTDSHRYLLNNRSIYLKPNN